MSSFSEIKPYTSLLESYVEATYTKCYCEENVWMLGEHIQNHHQEQLSDCFVVFISNDARTAPLWKQKAATCQHTYVCWDYHVILVHRRSTASMVYDMDSRLGIPVVFTEYVQQTLGCEEKFYSHIKRHFRVIPVAIFLQHFASDRSHMLSEDQKFQAEPPLYECIKTAESSNNIQDFIDMKVDTGWGEVMGQGQFITFMSGEETLELSDLINNRCDCKRKNSETNEDADNSGSGDRVKGDSEDRVKGDSEDKVKVDSEDRVKVDSEDRVKGVSEDKVKGDSGDKVKGDSEDKVNCDSEDKVKCDSKDKVKGDSEDKVNGDSEAKSTNKGGRSYEEQNKES